jgi:Ca-activated chloride channel family protein
MITGRRVAAVLCGLSAALAPLLLPATPASADETTAHDPPKVELVLDVSGSMRARDVDGASRMSAAQQAFDEVIDAVPDEVRLGIRTLGATYPGDDKSVGCKDSELLYPIGPVDRTEAKTAVATLRPTGWTPIGYALRKADQDLGDSGGTRRIVLITDGEDSCGQPDPCDVARELAAHGTHLVIDTLGLTLDAGTREQLSCIARATGGTYTAVQHTDQLTDRLKQLVRRSAATPVQNPTALQGGEHCKDAPTLRPGVYSDREVFGQHRWYQVAVQPGQELRASVSVAADRAVNPDYGVLLRAVDLDGRELVRGSEAGSGRTDVISTGLRYPLPEVDHPENKTFAPVCLEVSTSFSAPDGVQREPGMPVELSVDVVDGPDQPSDVAAFGLARGWIALVVLGLVGLVAGLVWGLLAQWRVSIRRAP